MIAFPDEACAARCESILIAEVTIHKQNMNEIISMTLHQWYVFYQRGPNALIKIS